MRRDLAASRRIRVRTSHLSRKNAISVTTAKKRDGGREDALIVRTDVEALLRRDLKEEMNDRLDELCRVIDLDQAQATICAELQANEPRLCPGCELVVLEPRLVVLVVVVLRENGQGLRVSILDISCT